MKAVSYKEMENGKPYRVNDACYTWHEKLVVVTPLLRSVHFLAILSDGEFSECYLTKSERDEKIFEPLDKPLKF